MRIDPTLADKFEKLDSISAQFRQKDGESLVRLEKALYGCKESGRLWYKKLTSFLFSIAFRSNPKDPCVWNLSRNGFSLQYAFV